MVVRFHFVRLEEGRLWFAKGYVRNAAKSLIV
jgi:hypothetical protein